MCSPTDASWWSVAFQHDGEALEILDSLEECLRWVAGRREHPVWFVVIAHDDMGEPIQQLCLVDAPLMRAIAALPPAPLDT